MAKKKKINFKFDLNLPINGYSSIKLRFDHNGKRFVYGAKKSIITDLWDKETQRPTTDKERIKSYKKERPQIETELQNISARLDKIISDTKRYFSLKEEQGEPVNLTDLKIFLDKSFKTIKETRTPKKQPKTAPEVSQTPTIKDLTHEYIKGMYTGKKRTKQRQNYDHNTIKAYMTFKNMFDEMESYFDKTYLVTDISFDFENDLHEFFNEVKEYTPNTKGKMIKMLKVIIHDFLETESTRIYENHKKGIETVLSIIDLNYIEKQLDRIIKPKSDPVNIALNEKELQTMYELDYTEKPHLDRARDIFLTGCFTGLRHSDYSRIGPEHLNQDYIQIIMFKTKERVIIPIIPELVSIFKKWDYNIPDMSSQELNRYIKEIGKESGITDLTEITESKGNQTIINRKPKNEMITTHTARRSFATNSFYNGMNPQDIMKITGHKKLETFQKYIIHDPNREKERQENIKLYKRSLLKVV